MGSGGRRLRTQLDTMEHSDLAGPAEARQPPRSAATAAVGPPPPPTGSTSIAEQPARKRNKSSPSGSPRSDQSEGKAMECRVCHLPIARASKSCQLARLCQEHLHQKFPDRHNPHDSSRWEMFCTHCGSMKGDGHFIPGRKTCLRKPGAKNNTVKAGKRRGVTVPSSSDGASHSAGAREPHSSLAASTATASTTLSSQRASPARSSGGGAAASSGPASGAAPAAAGRLLLPPAPVVTTSLVPAARVALAPARRTQHSFPALALPPQQQQQLALPGSQRQHHLHSQPAVLHQGASGTQRQPSAQVLMPFASLGVQEGEEEEDWLAPFRPADEQDDTIAQMLSDEHVPSHDLGALQVGLQGVSGLQLPAAGALPALEPALFSPSTATHVTGLGGAGMSSAALEQSSGADWPGGMVQATRMGPATPESSSLLPLDSVMGRSSLFDGSR